MFYDHIDAILANVIQTLYNGGQFGVGDWTLARILGYADTPAAADIKAILSQVSLVVCAVFALVLIVAVLKKRAIGEAAPVQEEAPAAAEPVTVAPVTGALTGRWNEVVGHLDSARETDWKLAVIEADKLVDTALGRAGFSGDTFGDRLSNIQPGSLLSLDGLWWAHKVRNRLAHEMDYFLRYTEARQAIAYYGAALSELRLIP